MNENDDPAADDEISLVDLLTTLGEENVTKYRIVEGDPLSARVDCRVEVWLSRPGWDSRVLASSTMTCDESRFLVTSMLEAFSEGVRVHVRTWVHEFPRDGV